MLHLRLASPNLCRLGATWIPPHSPLPPCHRLHLRVQSLLPRIHRHLSLLRGAAGIGKIPIGSPRRATLGLAVSPSWKGFPSRQLSSTRNTKLASREIILPAALPSRRSSKSLLATVKPCGKLGTAITTTRDPRTVNISADSLPCLSTRNHLVPGAPGRILLTPVTTFLVFYVPVPRFSTFSARAVETYPN